MRSEGGGYLMGMAAHDIDYVCALFGDPIAVCADVRTFVPERTRPDGSTLHVDADDTAALLLRMANGMLAVITSTAVALHENHRSFECFGSHGSLTMAGALLGTEEPEIRSGVVESSEGEVIAPSDRVPASGAALPKRRAAGAIRALALMLEDWVAGVRRAAQPGAHAPRRTPRPTGRGRRAAEQRGRRVGRAVSGRPVRWMFQYPDTHGVDGDMLDAGPLGEVAVAVEAAGWDGLALTEHPAPGVNWLSAGGHQTLDPFVALGYAAAVTRRIRLLTYLAVLPYRNPLLRREGGGHGRPALERTLRPRRGGRLPEVGVPGARRRLRRAQRAVRRGPRRDPAPLGRRAVHLRGPPLQRTRRDRAAPSGTGPDPDLDRGQQRACPATGGRSGPGLDAAHERRRHLGHDPLAPHLLHGGARRPRPRLARAGGCPRRCARRRRRVRRPDRRRPDRRRRPPPYGAGRTRRCRGDVDRGPRTRVDVTARTRTFIDEFATTYITE